MRRKTLFLVSTVARCGSGRFLQASLARSSVLAHDHNPVTPHFCIEAAWVPPV